MPARGRARAVSGLCGVFQRQGAADSLREALDTLLADLVDFGTEECRWDGPGCALGQRQEHIYRRDFLEHQPVMAGPLVLVADARLINAAALAGALGIAPRRRHQIADSALLLAAWQRRGERVLETLEGEFCFAIWDTQARQLTLVRDHLGNRPLYYALWPGGFAFSSSLSGLPRLPGVDTRIDECAIADYLGPRATENHSTPFLGIRRLPPGCVATWSAASHKLRARHYWQIETAPFIRLPKPRDYPEAVRARVETLLAHCCDTDQGVGVVLSGGLDSSTLAALTARQLMAQGRELLTASSVLPTDHQGPAEDERPFVEAVCAQYPNMIPHWVTADDGSIFADTDTDLRHRGQPPTNPFAVMDRALHTTLQQSGARVVIDGLHGDSVWSFEHPHCLLDFLFRGQARTAWREWAALSRGYRIGRRTMLTWALAPYAAWLPAWSGDFPTRLAARCGPSAVTLELAHRTRLLQRTQKLDRRGGARPRPGAVQRADMAHPVWLRLREEIARSGAMLGLSLRSPLWDRRLVELCLSAPPEVLIRKGMGRSLVRQLGIGVIPELVRTRTTKGAFLPDFHARVRREAGIITTALERAGASRLATQCVDIARIHQALAGMTGEVAARHWTLDAQCVIYRGVKAAAFLRLYEGGELFRGA